MSDVIEHSISAITSLHTASIDALKGYEEARDDAHGKGMAPLFQTMIAIHTKNANDLEAYLSRHSNPTTDDGSFMSMVHKAVFSVRALFGGLDESVLPGLIDGEKRNIAHFDDVLASPDLPPDAHEVALTCRERLEGALTQMEVQHP